jgi:hypothetical protein
MREIFKPEPGQELELGRLFYTITGDDVDKRFIRTTKCVIELGSVIGRVLRQDVGKRLYRVRCEDPAAGWVWQCESARQRDERKARQLHDELTAIRETTQAGVLRQAD